MKNTLYCLLLLSALSLLSCSKKITAGIPLLSETNFKLDSLPSSEIVIPVQVNLRPFYALAEKQVDTLFTSPGYPDKWVQPSCDTRYKYTFRRGPLQFRAAGMALNLGFTGYYRIIGSTRVCVSGASLSPWTPPCRCGFDEAERRVNVSFNNSLAITPDYKIKLNIKRNEPQPLDKCEICFWGQDITKQVLAGLTAELDASKAALDKSYGTVDLRKEFQQLWDQLNAPYNVYGMGFLQINPEKLKINNVAARGDSLYLTLGLAARPAVSFERQSVSPRKIPDMGEFGRRDGFSIFVDASLNYDSLSTIMNRHLVNKEFDFNKGPVRKKFIIKECRLSGAGNEKLIIRINFSGTDNGTIYFTGRPVYTRETRVLEIKDLDFDIRSKDALLKGAEWLFSRRIINEVAKNTRFELGTYLDSARATINAQLNQEWIKGVSSKGTVSNIELIGVYPTSGALVIRSNCQGSLRVDVDKIDFSF